MLAALTTVSQARGHTVRPTEVARYFRRQPADCALIRDAGDACAVVASAQYRQPSGLLMGALETSPPWRAVTLT
jgi:hypothetical protein